MTTFDCDFAGKHYSAKRQWERGTHATRWKMLQEVHTHPRKTLTLRAFDDLPTEVKLDLNYAADRKHAANAPQLETEAA